jgi:hypothetical protein
VISHRPTQTDGKSCDQPQTHTDMRSMSTAVSVLALSLFCLLLPTACVMECPDATREIVHAEPRAPARPPEVARRPAPFDRNAVYTRELYVAPNGSDNTGDGSEGAPFATLQRASREAKPGTRIHLFAGRYAPAGTVPDLQGEPGAPIAIIGHEKAVIDGSLSGEVMPGIHLSNPRYVVLENLHIRNAYPHGVNIDDGGEYATPAGPITLRGVRIANVGRGGNNDCLKLSGVDRFQVLDCEFSGCDRGEAIDMVGCHDGFISGNTFRDMPGSALQTKGGSSDIVIHGNRFINIALRSVNLGGHTGTPYFRPLDAPFEAARIQVVSNIFYRSGGAAVAFVGCVDCLAAHNTIVDPQGHVVRLLEEHPERGVGRSGRFINNLIAFKVADLEGYVTAGRRTRPDTFILGWNLWYARDRKGFRGPNHSRRVPPERSAVVGVAPRFVDPAAGDYRLNPDSPAIGRALRMPDNTLPDYDARIRGFPPTIGAHGAP